MCSSSCCSTTFPNFWIDCTKTDGCRSLMLMWNRVRRFSALPPEARRLFLRAAVMLPMVALSLKLRGFRATQEWLQKRTFPTRADRGPSTVGQRCDTHVADAIVDWNVRMVNA